MTEITNRERGVSRGTAAAVIDAVCPYLNVLGQRLSELEQRVDEGGLAAALDELNRPPSIEELGERLLALEERLNTLEKEPPGFRYRGVWSTTHEYREDEMVTMAGALWVARASCCGIRPGTDETWQLAVKRARTR